jgi:hypothetical protein
VKYQIIAGDNIIDGTGSHQRSDELLKRASNRGLPIVTLEIAPLRSPWDEKLSPLHFKSGASAMAALKKAIQLLKSKKAAVVAIKGVDLLKTGYSKEEREQCMRLYSGKYTPLDGYQKLVAPFKSYHGISSRDFSRIQEALFENYWMTWKTLHPEAKLPDEKWFRPINKYFRGVDCANPNIDYSGQLVITNVEHADLLKVPKKERVRILGNAFTKLSVDGLESIPKIAPYLHLKRTIHQALKEAQLDFKAEFLNGHALLESYTCYPMVPMALLLRLGLVKHLSEIPDLLKQHEITITGGLNLARAPWNLTSLNYLIAMRERLLRSKTHRYGLVHGNGSLGNQQGITILGKPVI